MATKSIFSEYNVTQPAVQSHIECESLVERKDDWVMTDTTDRANEDSMSVQHMDSAPGLNLTEESQPTPPRVASHLPRTIHLNNLVNNMKEKRFGVDSEATCSYCKRTGHQDSACSARGSPRVDHKAYPTATDVAQAQYIDSLCTERYIGKSFWSQWYAARRDADTKSKLREIRQTIEAHTAQAGPSPWADAPGLPNALRRHVSAWCSIGASRTSLSWIASGYMPRWPEQPQPQQFANGPGAHEYELESEENKFFKAELARQLEAGAYVEVTQPDWAKVIHPIDIRPKPNGGFRTITDCRYINLFSAHMAYHNEDLRDLFATVQPNDWVFSTDLKDAYFHVPLHEDLWPYMCFAYEDKVYFTKVAPFGWNLSAYVFCALVKEVTTFLRSVAISVLGYMDDWFWGERTNPDARELAQFAVWLLDTLGFSLNAIKSELDPSQGSDFIGATIDTVEYTMRPTDRRVKKTMALLSQINTMAANGSKIQGILLEQVTGCIQSMEFVLPLTHLHTKALYRDIHARIGHHLTKQHISPEAWAEVQYWLRTLPMAQGKRILPRLRDMDISTDASASGWGAVSPLGRVAGPLPQHLLAASSTARELYGILSALSYWHQQLADQAVLVHCDNQAAVYILGKQKSRAADCDELADAIFGIAEPHGIDIRAIWIPRAWNTTADRLSRLVAMYDWCLQPDTFNAICAVWGKPEVDRFANSASALLPTYNSIEEDRDAFSESWQTTYNYVNPPAHLAGQAIFHLQRTGGRGIYILPQWPSQPWWPTLLRHAVHIMFIPVSTVTFRHAHPRTVPERAHLPNVPMIAALLEF